VSNHITPAPTPTTKLPESWEKAAQIAAQRADMKVRAEYEATAQAYDKQRASDEPAYWLAGDPCPAWCTNGPLHKSSDGPADREHDSDIMRQSLNSMPPITAFADFRAPEVTLTLTKKYREVEARVEISTSDQDAYFATLDEAEGLAFALLDLVRQGRGQEPPKLQLFDSTGRCVTRECVTCHAEAEGASA
jgi:hypothetical protein